MSAGTVVFVGLILACVGTGTSGTSEGPLAIADDRWGGADERAAEGEDRFLIPGSDVGLPAAFEGMKVANRGISGDTTRGVLIRLEEDVLALDPAAVVLLIGTNDLEESATPEVTAANVQLILGAAPFSAPKNKSGSGLISIRP